MIAHELHTDIDLVRSWSVGKVRGWMTYFEVKNDFEAEAYEIAKRKARNQR